MVSVNQCARSHLIVSDQAYSGGVISKRYDGIAGVYGYTVLCDQGVQQRAQNTALWQRQCGGDVKSNMQMLASVGEEIYSPIVQVFSEFQIAQICVELRWIHGLEG